MIVLDGIAFSLQEHGGISTYFRELATRVALNHSEAQLWRFEGTDGRGLPAAQTVVHPARHLERYRPIRGISPGSIVHSSYYRTTSAARAVNVVTVYDFMYERFATGLPRWVHSWQKRRAIQRADALICISESTKSDLLHYYPRVPESRIHVVYLAASAAFFPLSLPQDREHARPFALFVGGRLGHKNFPAAVRGIASVPELDLVCVGGGEFASDEAALISRLLPGRVSHRAGVTTEELNALYNAAHCLIYPSLFEGFGIPLLEAMAAGCPAVTTNGSSMSEISGGSAILLASPDPESIADGARQLFDPEVRREYSELGRVNARRFSWDRTAHETMAIYAALA